MIFEFKKYIDVSSTGGGGDFWHLTLSSIVQDYI